LKYLVEIRPFTTTAASECSLYCGVKDSDPLCAHCFALGFRNFPDKCAVENANHCSGEDWTVIHPGDCTPPEIKGCPPKYQPVCGKNTKGDYKTYANKCFLDAEYLYKGYMYIHDGPCTPKEVPPKVCPGVCTKEYNPICGYSALCGHFTFPNKCYFDNENKCNPYCSFALKHTKECTKEELASNCKRRCPDTPYPICGYSVNLGLKNFDNLCKLIFENFCLGADYAVKHVGHCTIDEIASFCKPGFCPNDYDPVCASKGHLFRTFRNKCYFNVENFCEKGLYKLEHLRECTPKEIGQSCSLKCPPSDELVVCGFSLVSGYKTYRNKCYLLYDNTCYGKEYKLAHVGECKKDELGLICKKEFCSKYKGQKVCGKSPYKGYKTFDNECFLYSENTCKYGEYELKHYGECDAKELNSFCEFDTCYIRGNPVCGFSPKDGFLTFSNKCYLYKANLCKGKHYELRHEGECTIYELEGKCPLICSQECEYICGHSVVLGYKTFYNKCDLEAENGCKGGDYKFLHPGECTKKELEKNCQLQCFLYEYKPVCALGPDGPVELENMCYYILQRACFGKELSLKHGGVCEAPELPPHPPIPPKCEPKVCTLEYNPVCAYSKAYNIFKTYSNKCFYESDLKCKPYYGLEYAHDKACTTEELESKCPRWCSDELSPVCGVSPIHGYKVFKNRCLLLLALSCYRSDYTLAHDGVCTPKEAPLCKFGCKKQPLDPVCAYSPKKGFKTFDNKCQWELANQCLFGDYIFAHAGKCSKPEIENDCDRVCIATYEPVCGYSPSLGYKTYPNRCSYLRELSCLGCDYVFIDEGKCKYPEGPQEGCPVLCDDDEKSPVCAFSESDYSYLTFPNQCLVTSTNKCNYGDYVVSHKGECKKGNGGYNCYRNCPFEYKPICCYHKTHGFRTFPSICDLEVANHCDDADYSVAHEGKCSIKELGGACNHNCQLRYVGVCGYSHIKGYKTFANECFMDRENTCTYSDYKLVHYGKCTPKETEGKCKRDCQLIFSPICAKSPKDGYKTFANFCLMDLENSCNYCDYDFHHQGECFPWELCKNCKH